MIFLDFDGVLFDTVKEAYAVSTIANKRYNSIEEINYNCEHYRLFRKYRYLISPAWNYKYLLDELDNFQEDKILKQNYLSKIKNVTKDEYKGFEELYFKTREKLKNDNFEKWLYLNQSFSFLNKIKVLLIKYPNLFYIVTTKDKETVLRLLNIENIQFDSSRIYDRNDYAKYGNKKNIIAILMDNKKAIFIDDSLKHIEECSSIPNLECLQPSWGYVSINTDTVSEEFIANQINKHIEEKYV